MTELDKLPIVDTAWPEEAFVLTHPFVFRGLEYREIKYRPPTGRQIYSYYRSQDNDFRGLALQCAVIDEAALDAMHGADFARLMAEMGKYAAGVR